MVSLENKINRLEQQNRYLTCAIIILGLSFSFLIFLGAQSSNTTSNEIVARSIRIVNDLGENSAQIAATSDGFVGFYFNDLNGDLRFGMQMTPSGKTSISFFEENKSRLDIGVIDGNNGEEYSIQLIDRDGNQIWRIPNINLY